MSVPASMPDLPPAPPLTPRQRLTYLQYLAVWEATARLPDPLAWRLPDRVGDMWWRAAPEAQRKQVAANVARVAGHPPRDELESLVRRAYRAYARYWTDSFRAHRADIADIRRRCELDGVEHLDAFRDSGEGAIIITGHIGSWDIGAFFATNRGWPLTVVAEVVNPRPLFDRFVRLRRQLGMGVVPLVRGGDMIERLTEVVGGGGMATLLADRDLTKKGPVVDFFGEPCRLPPGPAALARRTGRPVVPAAFFTTPRGWRIHVRPAVDISGLDVIAGTQVVAHELEAMITQAPEQWHVFVPNWLADREPDHPALQDGAA